MPFSNRLDTGNASSPTVGSAIEITDTGSYLTTVPKTAESMSQDFGEQLAQKANIAQEEWIAPTLVNSWVENNPSLTPVRYMKDAMGFVHMKGRVKNGSDIMICTLPAGYLPASNLVFCGWNFTTTAATYSYIDATGVLRALATTAGGISLDNVYFKAEG